MNTTLNKIREFSLCSTSREKILKPLNKTKADDEELSFKYILDVLGIIGAAWCLRAINFKDQCLFLADVAESVLHIFEDKYPDDMRVRNCIDGIRKFHAGEITEEDLLVLRRAVNDAMTTSAHAHDSYAAACAAAYASYADASYAIAYACATDMDSSWDAKWKEIEELFIKYFCREIN